MKLLFIGSYQNKAAHSKFFFSIANCNNNSSIELLCKKYLPLAIVKSLNLIFPTINFEIAVNKRL